MSDLPEENLPERILLPEEIESALEPAGTLTPIEVPGPLPAPPLALHEIPAHAAPDSEPLLFQSFTQPPVKQPVRIPHFGHLLVLLLLIGVGFGCTAIAFLTAAHFRLWGIDLSAKSTGNIRFILGTEALLYFATFAVCLIAFPPLWSESYFTGLQWRGSVALQRFWQLAATALGCFTLAMLDGALLPGPTNAPIEKMIRTPGAAWLMFGFGVTLAPFFEEMFFRGFLLPALCTAWDWTAERIHHKSAPPLDANSHPQWSLPAMIFGSFLTSLPFAGIHAEQQGHSLGPFLLLIVVSLILCAVRLRTRSLAASTLVHACYNFFIFSITLVATSGFRHMDKF